jgi:thioredoxin reductase
LVIVGAGPAGMAAASAAAEQGVEVLMLDEQPRVGGQIARQPPAQFEVTPWLPGAAYRRPRQLIADIEADAAVRRMHGASVWGVFPGRDPSDRFEIMAVHDGQGLRIRAARVLVAAGCYEQPAPFPGWTLPGVMGVGAVQTLLKSQQVVPGERIVLAGSHPLMLVAAAQLAAAGRPVDAVVFAQSWRSVLGLRPWRAWWGRQALFDAAAALAMVRRAGSRLMFGALPSAALGADRVEQVRIIHHGGREEALDCDTLATCFGFLPSSELARQAGASARRLHNGEWAVVTDTLMRTSIAGLYAAGEVRGVAGAEAAAAEGELAGLAVAVDEALANLADIAPRLRRLQRTARRRRAFADELRRVSTLPVKRQRSMADPDTIVCRCETVTAREIAAALADNITADSASAVKLLTRVGMGPCQGRMCEHGVSQIIAHARGKPWPQPDGYVVRAPVKPVPIAALLNEPGLGLIDPVAIERRHEAQQESKP